MKKILTTLTVIAATALGAQGQTTVKFPNTGSYSFTGLTFDSVSVDLPGTDAFTDAKLLFGATGISSGIEIRVTDVTLSGQGITGSLIFPNSPNSEDPLEELLLYRNLTAPIPSNLARYEGTQMIDLTTPIEVWNSSQNTVSFNIEILNGTLAPGARIYYALQYSVDFAQINTAYSNVNLTAVPEPSAYAAAAGLLALFLWSSRRHLFKLAGARSSTSGPDENGAA